MPTLYQANVYFEGNAKGWSEKYVLDGERTGLPAPPATGSWDSLTMIDSFFDQLVQKRRLLLGKEFNIVAQKITKIPYDRRSRLGYRFYPGNSTLPAEDVHTDLVVSCDNADDSRHKIIHMGGIPDSIVVNGGIFDASPPGWNTNWASYTGALTAGAYGWYGRSVGFRADITQYTTEVDTGCIVIDLEDTIFTGITVGTVLQVRVSRCQPREINGQLTVKVQNTSRCITTQPISLFPYKTGGQLRYNTPAFIPFAQVRPQKIGRRPRGAPLFQLRGRARARIRA